MSIDETVDRGMKSEMNITPLIDVLLVLLAIFMVIVPAMPKGDAALVPRAANDRREDAVVLEVLKNAGSEPKFTINRQVVSRENLPGRLAEIFVNRAAGAVRERRRSVAVCSNR